MHALLDTEALTIPEGSTVLHCAPSEGRLVERFRKPAAEYVPADIEPHKYNVPRIQKIDLMDMVDEQRFDRIYASHVMEHVPDDLLVLDNLKRALKTGGEAWLLVPLWEKPTEDGPAYLDPRERERRFGQWDHMRQYGVDFADRISAVGLTVEVIDRSTLISTEADRMGLSDSVFRAKRND